MHIEGVIANVTYYSQENSFAVLRMTSNGKFITAKGICPDLNVVNVQKAKGLSCTLDGNWVKDPRYGEEFDASVIRINNEVAHVAKQ
ncbi:MAG: YrrC family ATP-dependent DNA helicase [Athalassotoga sp.]